MITITYRFDIEGVDLQDLPPGAVDYLTRVVTDELNTTMEPIKKRILDGTLVQVGRIRSTGKLRKSQ